MAQSNHKHTAATSVKSSRRSVLGAVVHLMVSSVLMSLLAWIFLILGFGTYQIFKGQEVVHTQIVAIIQNNETILVGKKNIIQETIQKNISTQIKAVKKGINEIKEEVSEINEKDIKEKEKNVFDSVLMKASGMEVKQWTHPKIHSTHAKTQQKMLNLSSRITSMTRIWKATVTSFVTLFYGVTHIILTRWVIFLCALPLLGLFIGLSVVDGLVQRDIRKFQGARESSYFFHRIKMAWKPCFFAPLLGYFSWPWVAHPLWFFIPMALCLSVMIRWSLRLFKKYV